MNSFTFIRVQNGCETYSTTERERRHFVLTAGFGVARFDLVLLPVALFPAVFGRRA